MQWRAFCTNCSNTCIIPECIYEDNEEFKNHLEVTKSWFERISFVNKKLYLLALLEDVRSAWTLSLLLKSIWNSRPKDSLFSISRYNLHHIFLPLEYVIRFWIMISITLGLSLSCFLNRTIILELFIVLWWCFVDVKYWAATTKHHSITTELLCPCPFLHKLWRTIENGLFP